MQIYYRNKNIMNGFHLRAIFGKLIARFQHPQVIFHIINIFDLNYNACWALFDTNPFENSINDWAHKVLPFGSLHNKATWGRVDEPSNFLQ